MSKNRNKQAKTLSNKWQSDPEYRARMIARQVQQGLRSYGTTITPTPKERRRIKYPTLNEYLKMLPMSGTPRNQGDYLL